MVSSVVMAMVVQVFQLVFKEITDFFFKPKQICVVCVLFS